MTCISRCRYEGKHSYWDGVITFSEYDPYAHWDPTTGYSAAGIHQREIVFPDGGLKDDARILPGTLSCNVLGIGCRETNTSKS